jgi:CheY-specific phosphatase CheX
MKAEHVNAFLKPAVQVLQKMACTEVKVGKVSRLGQSLGSGEHHHLSIIIGLKGRLSGSVILTAPRPVAVSLAALIVKEPAEEMAEDDVRAIMAEVANTIVGNATGLLYDLGFHEGITPPTVVIGPDVSFGFDAGVESVQIPLATGAGEIAIVVSLTRETP